MLRAIAATVLLALAAPSWAQTQTLQQQVTQLRNYVIQLATKRNEDFQKIEVLRQENTQLRQYLADERVFFVDFVCKYNLLTENLATATGAEPTGKITFIQGVACGKTDPKTDPAPLFPAVPLAPVQ